VLANENERNRFTDIYVFQKNRFCDKRIWNKFGLGGSYVGYFDLVVV
jgi:hypothetical protein